MSSKDKFKFQLNTLINTHINPFVIIDEDYTIVAANKAYCDRYNKSEEEIIGAKCHQVSHKCDAPCSKYNEDCPLDEVMETNERYEAFQIRHDPYNQSEHVRIIGYPLQDEEGNRYMGEELVQTTKASELGQMDQQLIGRSEAFLEYMEQASMAAESDANLLITGESGTGKDRTAQYIHRRSHRSNNPFVTLSCATTNAAFLGSELFGHEQNALPASPGRRQGLIEAADGGTLYLDGIGDLPIELQGRLLHFIETGQYSRVGGNEVLESDVRIISSCNRNLETMINVGRFRADLFYRLSSIAFRIPPLRDRREDIALLMEHFLDILGKLNNQEYTIDKEARRLLVNHHYNGNIRELENLLLRASNLCKNGRIGVKHIKIQEVAAVEEERLTASTSHQDADRSIKLVEATHIHQLLEKHGGHRRTVADILGISERTLYRKLVKYNLTTVGKQ